MEPATLTISCQGATTLKLAELNELQGNLKDLSEGNYVKLRNSMLEYGFSFPVFFWQDTEGNKWILDAHQRVRTLKKMQEEGNIIPPLPADPIFAKDKVEAKKKLLLLNSRYGKLTREGYDEFIDDPTAPVNEDDLSDLLVIPEVGLFLTPSSDPEDLGDNPDKIREITCPNCQHKFNLFANKDTG